MDELTMTQPGSKVEMVREAARAAGEARGDAAHAVIATDDAGTILYWNAAAERLYGWRSAEALGRNVVDVTPAMMSQGEAGDIMHRLVGGKPWAGEFTVRSRDGTPMIVHVSDTPIVHDGTVIGIVGVSHRR